MHTESQQQSNLARATCCATKSISPAFPAREIAWVGLKLKLRDAIRTFIAHHSRVDMEPDGQQGRHPPVRQSNLTNFFGEHLKFDSVANLPKKRDLCFFFLGVLCARPTLLFSLFNHIEDSINYLESSFVTFFGHCGIVARTIHDVGWEWDIYWLRLIVEVFHAIAFVRIKCNKVMKEFLCPMCLTEDTGVFGVARPSECQHYGCTKCMQDWISTPAYNGCPLCRKKSQLTVDIAEDVCDMFIIYTGFDLCWLILRVKSMYDAGYVDWSEPILMAFWVVVATRAIGFGTCLLLDSRAAAKGKHDCN